MKKSKNLSNIIHKEMVKEHVGLCNIPSGFLLRFALKHNLNFAEVKTSIQILEEDLNVKSGITKHNSFSELHFSENDRFVINTLKEEGFDRSCPSKEIRFCRKTGYILDILPKGGNGLVIGTPTTHSICINNHVYKNKILDDNYILISKFKKVVDKLKIIIGNLRNPKKTETKVKLFNYFMPDIQVESLPYNRYSYSDYIRDIANQGILTKVLFMASGTWKGCIGNRRYKEHMYEIASSDISKSYYNCPYR